MIKKIAVAGFILCLLLAGVGRKPVQSAELDLYCDNSGCTPSTVTDYFPTDKWYPGREVVKTFRIQNTSDSPKQAALGTYDESASGGMADAVWLTVRSVPSGNILWTDTFTETFRNDEISLGEIRPSEVKDYEIILKMDEGAGNNLADQAFSFSMRIGFTEPDPGPTATPSSSTSTPIPTGSTASAFSRFVIRNVPNRAVVTIAPVLGIEEARIPRPTAGSYNPWMSSLFRGVSCHVSYGGLAGFVIQLAASIAFIKLYRRRNFQMIALALALFMVMTVFYALSATCFSFLPLFWLGLGVLSMSIYLVIHLNTPQQLVS